MSRQECKHFTGMMNQTCGAGIEYMSVRDVSQRPYAWPCLQLGKARECKTTCNKRELMTADEFKVRDAEMDRAIEAAMGGKCPKCGADLIREATKLTAVWTCPAHGFVRRDCNLIDD